MKKKLIIALVVVALLVGLTVLLFLLPEAEDEPVVSASPSTDVSLEPDERTYLINEQFSKLSVVRAFDADGELLSEITLTADEKGNTVYNITDPREGWSYDDEAMRATAVSVATLSSMSTVAQSTDDLAAYGLDEPTYIIEAEFENGARSYRIEVGDPTALANSYYCSTGDGKVYAVGAYSISQLTRSEMQYRTYEFFPDYYDTETLDYVTDGAIVYVRALDPATDYDMIIRKVEEGEFEEDEQFTDLYMDSPIKAFCVDAQVEDYFINGAVAIKVNGIYIDDPTDDQLAECGFSENSRKVWIKNEDGDEVCYTIGTMQSGNAYVMVEGVNTILTAESVYDAIFQIDYTTLIFKMLVTANISEVDTVDFDMDGDTHTLKVQYTPGTEGQSAVVVGFLDDAAISSTNTSRLYSRILALQIYEAYDVATTDVAAEASHTVTLNMHDGDKFTIALHRINDRRYAAFIDGEETGYMVHSDPIKDLASAFATIRSGGELTRLT